jgi:hypothetical protein
MFARLAKWRLRQHQLGSFRRTLISRVWQPVELPGGLWARPRLAVDTEKLPAHLRELLAGLQGNYPDYAQIAQGWIGLSSSTNPDFGEILLLACQVLDKNGVSRAPPESGLSFAMSFNAGFYPGLILDAGGYVSLNVGLLLSLDQLNEWVLGASDLHFGAGELMPGVEPIYLDWIHDALPFILGLAPEMFASPDGTLHRAFQQAERQAFDRYARMGHQIARIQKLWIVLHEFAHWHLGHRNMTGMGSLRQEHEADRQALLWLLDGEENHALLNGMVPTETAIPMLFDVLRCAERLHAPESDTHPSYGDRWRHIAGLGEIRARWSDAAFDTELFDYLVHQMETRRGQPSIL